MPRDRKHSDEEDSNEDGGDLCPVCHQEFANGICPIRSSDCPNQEEELDEDEDLEDEEEEDEDDEPDEDDEN